MFFSKKLAHFNNLKHCFFSRKNGVSKGVYKSLNCGLASHDNRENVLKNLEIVNNKMGCEENSIVTLKQMHSDKVIYFENKDSVKNNLAGDAIVTKIKNLAIGILTADCVPILLYDPNKKIMGCIHSGWKGALNGILKNTIKKFMDLNSNASDLVVAVGPCIKKEDYEVGYEFYQKFIKKNNSNEFFFEKKSNNKYIFDLREFINNELLSLKVKKIDNIEKNTFSDEETFFSYRRSRLKKEKDYGRCISVILMT